MSTPTSSNGAAPPKRTLSHDSISVTGAHPLGSLRVHRVDDRSSSLKPLEEHDRDQGDVVLVLDLPEKFTVGYDSISFNAKNFAGLKEIPRGAHFFWASETDASSMRSGFWFVAGEGGNVHMTQWDRFNDVLCEPASQTEARIQRSDLPAIYPKLPSYHSPLSKEQQQQGATDLRPLDDLKESGLWPRLAGCVTERMLRRVTGRPKGPWHVHTTDRVRGTIVLPAERELDKTISVVAVDELAFSFTQTDKTYTAESIGAVRTEQAVDSTSYITSALDDQASGLAEDDVAGEFQFAFLVAMHLGNESCAHQWWHMALGLVLRAFRLPTARPRLARLLLDALAAQLTYDESHLEGSILDFGADHPREMRLALTVYKRRLDELLLTLGGAASPEQAAVGEAFSALEEVAWKRGWDLRADYVRRGKVMLEDGEQVEVEMDDLEAEDERGEFAPEVVEMDEHGREKGLVSWT